MFKFDFKINEGNADISLNEKNNCHVSDNDLECYECQEVTIDEALLEDFDVCKLNSTELSIGKVKLLYMIPTHVLKRLDDSSSIQKAEENHTDLIPGVYEGGAKLWECTEDLLIYLETNFTTEEWKTKNVLDLGCGCGLLGIFALKFGATVHFQDYNDDVLEKVTIPNVLLNSETDDIDLEKVSNNMKFFSGDWSKFVDFTNDGPQFDFILTSETIYNAQNQNKLLKIFSKKLKPDGIVLVAAKTYYFGVGGSLRQFEDLIISSKLYDVKTVWTSSEGVNREIIELRRANMSENKMPKTLVN